MFIEPRNQGTSIVQPIRRKKVISPRTLYSCFYGFQHAQSGSSVCEESDWKEILTEEDIEAALNEQEDKKLENDDDAFYNFNKFKVLEDDES